MNTRTIWAGLVAAGLFLLTSLAAPDVQAVTYSFTTFDVPGAFGTYPNSINDSGQVTGWYWGEDYWDDGSPREHGFVYSNGTFTTLNVPGAIKTHPNSINASGQVTGSYWDGSRGHGFVYSNGAFTTFDGPGAPSTLATSINASGQVTGYYWDESGTHGFIYRNGAFTTLDVPGAIGTWATSINDSGQVTGYYNYYQSPAVHGFVYSNGTFTTLDGPRALRTWATSINASGQVAGIYWDSFCPSHGFLYSSGTFTTFEDPDASYTKVTSINDSGQVTGSYRKADFTNDPDGYSFVYSNGTFTAFKVPGANGTEATSINVSGQVTGSYSDGSHSHGFIATPVCATPTVTVHTLTTAPDGGFRLTGSITHEGIPLCALVLANGQFLFTCGDPLPKGNFDLTVPVDDQGQITLFGFSSGLAPFQQTLGPGALPASVNATRCATPKVTYTTAAAPEGKFRLTGSITLGSDPLCALVLANGQFLFTCGDPLPKGDFDLTVPPDDQGKITLFGFAAGLAPFQRTFSSSPCKGP